MATRQQRNSAASYASDGKAPRTARGEKTLRRILDAALAEFGERGFGESSIVGITSRAEVDAIADAARETQSPQQRAQLLSLAAQLIDSADSEGATIPGLMNSKIRP